MAVGLTFSDAQSVVCIGRNAITYFLVPTKSIYLSLSQIFVAQTTFYILPAQKKLPRNSKIYLECSSCNQIASATP
jgi:hypothetical protein